MNERPTEGAVRYVVVQDSDGDAGVYREVMEWQRRGRESMFYGKKNGDGQARKRAEAEASRLNGEVQSE